MAWKVKLIGAKTDTVYTYGVDSSPSASPRDVTRLALERHREMGEMGVVKEPATPVGTAKWEK